MFEISSQVTQLITHFWKIVESFVFQPSNESVSLGCRISSRCEKSGTFDFYLIVIWNSQTMKGRKVASHCEKIIISWIQRRVWFHVREIKSSAWKDFDHKLKWLLIGSFVFKQLFTFNFSSKPMKSSSFLAFLKINENFHWQTDSNRLDVASDGDDLNLREDWPDFSGIASRKLLKACSVEGLKSKLPVTKWLPNYHASYLLQDIIAGLSVGLTAIPQGVVFEINFHSELRFNKIFAQQASLTES